MSSWSLCNSSMLVSRPVWRSTNDSSRCASIMTHLARSLDQTSATSWPETSRPLSITFGKCPKTNRAWSPRLRAHYMYVMAYWTQKPL